MVSSQLDWPWWTAVMFQFSSSDQRRDWLSRATRYLRQANLRVLDSGLRETRAFDCVAADGDVLAFVIVRVRRVEISNDASDVNVDELAMAAQQWMSDHDYEADTAIRFDLLRLDWYGRNSAPIVRYFPAALAASCQPTGM